MSTSTRIQPAPIALTGLLGSVGLSADNNLDEVGPDAVVNVVDLHDNSRHSSPLDD